jgi:hypothetical protein
MGDLEGLLDGIYAPLSRGGALRETVDDDIQPSVLEITSLEIGDTNNLPAAKKAQKSLALESRRDDLYRLEASEGNGSYDENGPVRSLEGSEALEHRGGILRFNLLCALRTITS